MPSDQTETVAINMRDESAEALSAEDIQALATGFAHSLGEKEGKPSQQIGLLIKHCGLAFVKQIMAETEATENAGGMVTQDRKRRRTKGGVFFFLAKGQMNPDQRAEVFPNFGKHGDGTIAPPGIEWQARIAAMSALREQPGAVSNLAVTLTGRPGQLHIDGSSVMTVIEQRQVKAPPYPKGVPHFDTVEDITSYYVFMSLRHWNRVEKALEDEADLLIVEGTAVFDAQLGGITILSTRVSTKLLDQKKKKKAPEDSAGGNQSRGDASAMLKPKRAVQTMPDLSGMPEETAARLRKLHLAADKLRTKMTAMEDSNQTSGLAMTRRLLEQTEKQIASLLLQVEK